MTVSDTAAELVARSNRLGADPRNTNYAGGNTSAKGTAIDPVTQQPVDLVWVKGSGGDLGTLTEKGLAVLRQDRLNALVDVYPGVDREDEMVAAFDYCLHGKGGAAPSIDTAMHGLVDAPHVDHLHPDSGIALATAADGEKLTAECFGDRVVWVPWRRPGFQLGLDIAQVKKDNPQAIGVILGGHGITAWGDTSAECEANSLDIIRTAERFLAEQGKPEPFGAVVPGYEALPEAERRLRAAALAPLIRGLASTDNPQIGHYNDSDVVLEFTARERLGELAALGTSCPDHFLRTKVRPLVLDLPPTASIEEAATRLRELHLAYREDYAAYYDRHATPDSPPMRGADPAIVLVPGVGMFSFGKVTSVSTEDGKAVVEMKIDNDHDDIPKEGTTAAIRWRNLIGQRYVYLYPGPAGGEALQDGDDDRQRRPRSIDLGELFEQLGPDRHRHRSRPGEPTCWRPSPRPSTAGRTRSARRSTTSPPWPAARQPGRGHRPPRGQPRHGRGHPQPARRADRRDGAEPHQPVRRPSGTTRRPSTPRSPSSGKFGTDLNGVLDNNADRARPPPGQPRAGHRHRARPAPRARPVPGRASPRPARRSSGPATAASSSTRRSSAPSSRPPASSEAGCPIGDPILGPSTSAAAVHRRAGPRRRRDPLAPHEGDGRMKSFRDRNPYAVGIISMLVIAGHHRHGLHGRPAPPPRAHLHDGGHLHAGLRPARRRRREGGRGEGRAGHRHPRRPRGRARHGRPG